MNPQELLYCETHEWVHVQEDSGSKLATIGISAFAVEQLTDLVYIELPEPGQVVASGDEFGEVESVKAVSPLYCPVAGEITAVNTEIKDKLEVLGSDPYDAGWLIKVKISEESALSGLMDYAAYQKQCAEES